jgi:hypothetical protein
MYPCTAMPPEVREFDQNNQSATGLHPEYQEYHCRFQEYSVHVAEFFRIEFVNAHQ